MSEDQKRTAVSQVQSGQPRKVVAKRFKVSTSTLDLWRKRYATQRTNHVAHLKAHVVAVAKQNVSESITQLQAENDALYSMLGRMVMGRAITEVRKAG